ncbi:hypothetical protein EVAR_9345_1 [Eumeta japonica]|uniref:Uncharacterized protein n=1 Tax=Eumeta variegata TaxID=151549 RepID=A0A4C1YQA9_EUMVA|nr:hypothetical protein EVAR_9345_1 [Eumeta japonica]
MGASEGEAAGKGGGTPPALVVATHRNRIRDRHLPLEPRVTLLADFCEGRLSEGPKVLCKNALDSGLAVGLSGGALGKVPAL